MRPVISKGAASLIGYWVVGISMAVFHLMLCAAFMTLSAALTSSTVWVFAAAVVAGSVCAPTYKWFSVTTVTTEKS